MSVAIHFLLAAAVASPWSDRLPPVRFQGDNDAEIVFTPFERIPAICHNPPPPQGKVALGCSWTEPSGHRVIVVPNPCLEKRQSYYDKILCHEIGHLNGWPADHGD